MTSVEREVRKGYSQGRGRELRSDRKKVRGEREKGRAGRKRVREMDERIESVWRWQSERQ